MTSEGGPPATGAPTNQAAQAPLAEVRPAGAWLAVWRRQGQVWWLLPVLCLIIAIILVVNARRARGPSITVQFADGHGIQPGDRLRYRGIEVGEVTRVLLAKQMDGVELQLRLDPTGAALAREGTRFWIERPQVSLAHVRGLDTVIGPKYVAVLPGLADGPDQFEFVGLETAPVQVERGQGGLELLLDSPHRYGVERGAPVSYRGVIVGRILSVELAHDAASVEVRAYIFPDYRALIRENTRFWSTSGVDLQIGVRGVRFSADTLATIVAGGVSLATPVEPGQPVSTGHRFELVKLSDDVADWQLWKPRLPLGDELLPPGASLPRPMRGLLRWERKRLGIRRAQEQEGWVLLLDDRRALAPGNMLLPPDNAAEPVATLEVAGSQFAVPAANIRSHGGLALAPLDQEPPANAGRWSPSALRVPTEPEDCLLVWGGRDQQVPLAASRIEVAPSRWQVDPSLPLATDAHGAAVVAQRDGAVIGLLVIDDGERFIAPLTRELLATSPPGPATGDRNR